MLKGNWTRSGVLLLIAAIVAAIGFALTSLAAGAESQRLADGTMTIYDYASDEWTAHVAESAAAWDAILPTVSFEVVKGEHRKSCAPVEGAITICSGDYGNDKLGRAEWSGASPTITAATIILNTRLHIEGAYSQNVWRQTVCHELGHIVLGHVEHPTTKSCLSDNEPSTKPTAWDVRQATLLYGGSQEKKDKPKDAIVPTSPICDAVGYEEVEGEEGGAEDDLYVTDEAGDYEPNCGDADEGYIENDNDERGSVEQDEGTVSVDPPQPLTDAQIAAAAEGTAREMRQRDKENERRARKGGCVYIC